MLSPSNYFAFLKLKLELIGDHYASVGDSKICDSQIESVFDWWLFSSRVKKLENRDNNITCLDFLLFFSSFSKHCRNAYRTHLVFIWITAESNKQKILKYQRKQYAKHEIYFKWSLISNNKHSSLKFKSKLQCMKLHRKRESSPIQK